MKQFRHNSIIGEKATIFSYNKLSHGIITDSYMEDNRHIVQIDNDYEVVVNRCEEILDLITRDKTIRIFVL